MGTISSNQIKFIRSLSMKKFRQESGLFVVEGEKLVNEAIASPFKVRDIYRIEDIGHESMKRISNLATPSPVLAVVEQRNKELSFYRENLLELLLEKTSSNDSITPQRPLFLALDGVKDPGNLGTIIRIADWFGINSIFASEDTVEMYNPKVVQATMGAIFRKPVIYGNLHDIVDTFAEAEYPIYGTFLNGQNLYEQNEGFNKCGLIVMGSESFGISNALGEKITSKILIPPYPANSYTSESLNVAIATAIICAEFRRP